MSTGAVVDVLLTTADMKLPQEQFIERIIEPALARLNHYHKPGDKETTTHLRITVRSFTPEQWENMYPFIDAVDER